MNDQHDLTLILKSRFPLVMIETPEEPRVLSLIERVANLEEIPLFKWSVTDGIRRHNKTEPIAQTYDFMEAIRHIDKTPQNGVYVLLDAHPFLDNAVNLRVLNAGVKSCNQAFPHNERSGQVLQSGISS